MKSLTRYITEKYNTKIVNDLVVEYDSPKHKLYIDAPSTYEESDIQQYIDDYILSKLPNDSTIGKKAFGINFSFISDAYFEYDKYEKLNRKLKDIDLEWNEEYANENVDQDEKLNTFILYNLRYILKFDKFNVMYDDDAKQTLNDIFSSYESNDMNKYPIELKYKKEKLLFIER